LKTHLQNLIEAELNRTGFTALAKGQGIEVNVGPIYTVIADPNCEYAAPSKRLYAALTLHHDREFNDEDAEDNYRYFLENTPLRLQSEIEEDGGPAEWLAACHDSGWETFNDYVWEAWDLDDQIERLGTIEYAAHTYLAAAALGDVVDLDGLPYSGQYCHICEMDVAQDQRDPVQLGEHLICHQCLEESIIRDQHDREAARTRLVTIARLAVAAASTEAPDRLAKAAYAKAVDALKRIAVIAACDATAVTRNPDCPCPVCSTDSASAVDIDTDAVEGRR
jgi:hypothetical protein